MVWNCHFQSIVNERESGKHGTATLMIPGERRTHPHHAETDNPQAICTKVVIPKRQPFSLIHQQSFPKLFVTHCICVD